MPTSRRPAAKSRIPAKRTVSSPEDARLVRGRDVRMRLIVAATKAFGTYGFAGTSLRTIAEDAGIAFQLITYHFGSKEDLWEAVLTHLFEQRLEDLRARRFDPKGDLDVQVRDWIRHALLMSMDEPSMRRLVTQEYFVDSARHQRFLKPKIEEFMRESTRIHRQLAMAGFGNHFTSAEMQLIFRSVIAANCAMPYEVQMTLGTAAGSTKYLELQTELLFNLFKHGRGTPRNSAIRLPRGARGSRA